MKAKITKLKLSKYTHFFCRDKAYYIFNSEACVFIEISKELFCLIESNRIDEISKNEKNFLKQKRIIVKADDFEEFLCKSKIKYLSNSYDPNALSLVLVPTTGCNFACPYCFEKNKQNIVMNDEVINNLITFVKGHVNAKKIFLTWYGGEPLIVFSTIKKIYTSIKENIDIPVTSRKLITNGYLLNENKIKYFKEIGLKSMQITLDGKRITHNTTRKLKKTNRGSYDIIIRNIDKVVSLFPECAISLRINISNSNKDEFFPLYKELSLRWKGQNLYIYPGFIREDSDNGCSFSCNTLNATDRLNFYQEIHAQGGSLNASPKNVDKGCMANTINSYIIGPQGEIYKCWNDVSNLNKIIGYINKKDFTNRKLFYAYMNQLSPFNDSSCTQCFLFPICSGGCSWYRYRNYFETGKFDICPYFKDKKKLEDLLLMSLKEGKHSIKTKKINCWS